jgi:hypothetical protein
VTVERVLELADAVVVTRDPDALHLERARHQVEGLARA